jgi:hypothetical protein
VGRLGLGADGRKRSQPHRAGLVGGQRRAVSGGAPCLLALRSDRRRVQVLGGAVDQRVRDLLDTIHTAHQDRAPVLLAVPSGDVMKGVAAAVEAIAPLCKERHPRERRLGQPRGAPSGKRIPAQESRPGERAEEHPQRQDAWPPWVCANEAGADG